MNETARYTVGIDVGTSHIRCAVLEISDNGSMSIAAYGETESKGMHKGVVSDLFGPATAINTMLADVEGMCSRPITAGYISINGSHISSTIVSGQIVLPPGSSITEDNIHSLEDNAISGRIQDNRNILAIVPIDYIIDGQSGIRDPLGMTGNRFELKANVLSALAPNCENLQKSVAEGQVDTIRQIPSVMAAARAVLTERQMENGVAVVDFGAATTSVAVYADGDLQYVGVIGAGANNITNDLAICLEITTDIAEQIKLKYVSADFPEGDSEIKFKHNNETAVFSRDQINEIVRDRLTEIFAKVEEMLGEAGFAQKLPEGVVLVGGGAKMRGIAAFAKQALNMATRIGIPGTDLAGAANQIEKPEYAAAVGLALMMAEENNFVVPKQPEEEKENFFSRLFGKKK